MLPVLDGVVSGCGGRGRDVGDVAPHAKVSRCVVVIFEGDSTAHIDEDAAAALDLIRGACDMCTRLKCHSLLTRCVHWRHPHTMCGSERVCVRARMCCPPTPRTPCAAARGCTEALFAGSGALPQAHVEPERLLLDGTRAVRDLDPCVVRIRRGRLSWRVVGCVPNVGLPKPEGRVVCRERALFEWVCVAHAFQRQQCCVDHIDLVDTRE
mmetsp:Transcript_15288/g.45851  ORF Transcript_15288/g.45851 Transcript_15288/m.45851 type:complete len:210 (+) Transcript_15288:265-894(+)